MWRKGNPFALLVGIQIGADTVKRSMELPQEIKNRTSLLPSNSTSENLSEETHDSFYLTPYFYTSSNSCYYWLKPERYKFIKALAAPQQTLFETIIKKYQ